MKRLEVVIGISERLLNFDRVLMLLLVYKFKFDGHELARESVLVVEPKGCR